MKRTIGVDVDGVLADFNSAYIERTVSIVGHDLFPSRPFDILTWNYPEYFGYTDDEVAKVWADIEQDDRFWQSLQPYPETEEAMAYIRILHRCGHDVYFITSRPGSTSKVQTERWLRKYEITPTVLISSLKAACAHALRLDVYIDDRWENAHDVAQHTDTTAFLLSRPWNQEFDAEAFGVARTSTVVGFADAPVAEAASRA